LDRAGITTGACGEELAAAYLAKKGCLILEKGYRYGHKEVDIIAEDHGTLVFVEVKSRRRGGAIPPYMSVNRRKQTHILKVAGAYLASHPRSREMDIRFDVISIVMPPENDARIEHIVDAFKPW